jgi:hypothetical protein
VKILAVMDEWVPDRPQHDHVLRAGWEGDPAAWECTVSGCTYLVWEDADDLGLEHDDGPVDPTDGLTDAEPPALAERYRSHWPDWACHDGGA